MLKQSCKNIGVKLHGWEKDLYPINRSITGPGLRETLKYLQGHLADLKIHSVPSGTDSPSTLELLEVGAKNVA